MTDFDTKCKILAELLAYTDEYNYFGEYIEIHDVSLGLAFAYTDGRVVDLTGYGVETIEQSWNDLLKYTGNENKEIDSFDSLLPEGL